MNEISALLQTCCPLTAVSLVFLVFGWAVGIRTRCRELIWQRLRQRHTKRAVKQMLRKQDSVFGWLILRRERQFGSDDTFVRRMIVFSNTVVLLLPVAEIICFLGKYLPLCTWISFLFAVTELLISFVLCICCIRKPAPRKKSPNEKISVAAYLLRYGYLLSAAICFLLHQLVFSGVFLLADALHIIIAKRLHADHFYCMMQRAMHLPMTPHHHSEQFKQNAAQESKAYAPLLTVLACGCFLAAILQMRR